MPQQFLFFAIGGSRGSQAGLSACLCLIRVCRLREIDSQAICCLLSSCQLLPGPMNRCTDARVHQSLVTERPQLLPLGREIFSPPVRAKGTHGFVLRRCSSTRIRFIFISPLASGAAPCSDWPPGSQGRFQHGRRQVAGSRFTCWAAGASSFVACVRVCVCVCFMIL